VRGKGLSARKSKSVRSHQGKSGSGTLTVRKGNRAEQYPFEIESVLHKGEKHAHPPLPENGEKRGPLLEKGTGELGLTKPHRGGGADFCVREFQAEGRGRRSFDHLTKEKRGKKKEFGSLSRGREPGSRPSRKKGNVFRF